MQRLLSAAVWDEAGARDDLRDYVLEHFADPGAVLVTDETGDLKHGTATVGAQRQYTGTAGRTENAQVAVYLAYAARAGCAFIDRALYLPRSWTCDPARCRAAGVPEGTAFATKPALARQMITRALDAGTPAGWVTADEVYGQDPVLRAELARRGLGYVLAIPRRHLVMTGIGAHTAIAGCAGIAGSTVIGRDCKIGGAAMISGHLEIADGTVISASTGVFSSIETPGVYTGAFPALPHRDWQHVASITRRLRALLGRIAALERKIRQEGE